MSPLLEGLIPLLLPLHLFQGLLRLKSIKYSACTPNSSTYTDIQYATPTPTIVGVGISLISDLRLNTSHNAAHQVNISNITALHTIGITYSIGLHISKQ